VGTGEYCRLSACDINGDGVIQTWDGMAVMHSMVGLDADDDEVFNCRPSVAFGVVGAVAMERVKFLVDYSNAGVEFTNKSGDVRCRAPEVAPIAALITTDDPVRRVVTIEIDLSEPVDGSLGLVECFVRPPEGGALPGPGAYIVAVSELASGGDGKTPTEISVLPGG
jgi:hypothetical protein